MLQLRGERAQQRLHAQRPELGLSDLDRFLVHRIQADELGQTHTRLRQFHQGVRVWGGEVIVHEGREGELLPLTLAHKGQIVLNVTPSLSEAEAIGAVQEHLAPKGPYAYPPRVELVILPQEVRVPRRGLRRAPEDLDATAFENQVLRYTLAYHVHAELENPDDTRHMDYLVNAHTGAILDSWDSLQAAGAVGSGKSQFSGTVALNTNTTASGYELRDTTRPASGGNTVNDMNHATSGIGTVYTDADNSWGDGLDYREAPEPTTSANGQTVAVDAVFGL
jgi:Zn-dependent metalloprotease